jgi:2-amino-4-hydroxy-6-hydroxymethyldihydropteridine diphosphokinase
MAEANEVAAYVAVGSNIEPRRNIAAAMALLRRRVPVTGVSTFYRTGPIDADGSRREGEDDFLNGAFAVRAACGARALKFDVLRPIEERLGRVRGPDRHAARTIDLDVILYGDEVIDEPDLEIPSRDLERAFVAIPLLELGPDIVLPGARQPLSCLWPGGAVAGMKPDAEFTRMLKGALDR